MAIAAVLSFHGFPDFPERHLLLPHDGYPTGVAWRLAAGLRACKPAADWPACFLRRQMEGQLLARPEAAPSAHYRYRVQYRTATAELQVQAWRRLPGSDTWILRCGPMPVAGFIRRFLPGDCPG